MHHPAVVIPQHLELDVPRPRQVLLQVDALVAEGRARLVPRHRELAQEVVGVLCHAHPLPAAAGRRLDQHREADLLRGGERLIRVTEDVGSRHDRHAHLHHGAPRGRLVAHQPDLLRVRANEGQLAPLADLRELRILGEEAVPRVDRVGTRDLRRRDDAGNVQIALPRRRRPDADVLVREANVQRLAVGLRVDGDRPDPELLAGPDHAKRDLPPIRDQYLTEHLFPLTRRDRHRRSFRRPPRSPMHGVRTRTGWSRSGAPRRA
jgi:hypothetical protein